MKKISNLFIAIVSLAYTVSATAQNVPTYIPTDGLVGWWPFNGNANDESGNGNDGTVNGVALATDRFGFTNSTYDFQGSGFIKIPNQNVNLDNITINIWHLKYNNLNRQSLIGSWNNNPNNNIRQYTLFCDNHIGYAVSNCGQNNSATSVVPLNVWQMISMVYDGNVLSLYHNGQLVHSSTYSCQINSVNDYWYAGAEDQDGTSVVQNYFGKLDDIAIWNRALTPQEISNLYTASNNNNNETSNTSANVPGAISYQAVARDAQGMPLADTNLQVRFTLIADSPSGTAEYVETHSLTTNSMGLFTTAFGAGTPVSNTFGNINWSAGNKFLQVQIDTGNGWIDMGTQQLLSTPYSMHSATSGAIKNSGLPVFADNAAALAGGLVAGDMYRTASGDLKIVY